MADYGLVATGFIRKSFEEIKSDLEASYKNIFGNDLDVSSESVAGQQIATLAISFSDLWEVAEAVYISLDPDGAVGISLDRVLQLTGLSRLGATHTIVQAVAIGDNNTFLAANQVAKQQETNLLFTSENGITITNSLALVTNIEVTTLADSTMYSVNVNGAVFMIDSGIGATKTSVLEALKTDIDLGSQPVITVVADEVLTISSDDFLTSFFCDLSANLDYISIGSLITFIANDSGSISVPEDTLTIIDTPISGWLSVNNELPGVTGRDLEIDEESRDRRRESLNVIGAGTVEAIRTRLRQEVASVTGVLVIENVLDVPDGDSRPPHSFECVVGGGDDQEIADKIWEVKPAGIQTYGSVSKDVTDSQGTIHEINFSRATEIYVWLKIEYTEYPEEEFPVDGVQQIKDAILEFAVTEYDIDKDVILGRLNTPIYTVSGVLDISITIASKLNPVDVPAGGEYSSNNLVIGSTETAVLADSRIEVTLV